MRSSHDSIPIGLVVRLYLAARRSTMRVASLFLLLSTVVTGTAFGQSSCETAKTGTNVVEKRPEFGNEIQNARTLFVIVYHNPQSGFVDPPPPESVKSTTATITRWPIATEEERGLVAHMKKEIVRWGRFNLTRDLSTADLILVAKLGRNAGDPVPNGGYFDIPLNFLWDDSLCLYSKAAKPGLVWCSKEGVRSGWRMSASYSGWKNIGSP